MDKPRFQPSIIDVAVLVDAPRILYCYGANQAKDNTYFSDYVPLGANSEGVGFVYMVTTWWDARGEGQSELSVFGTVGTKIRWRMRSLSMGGVADRLDNKPIVTYNASIRGFVINHGSEYISPPQKRIEKVTGWAFNEDGNVIHQETNDVYWESTVLRAGGGDKVVYHMPFNIFCDCSDCNGGGGGGGGGITGGGAVHGAGCEDGGEGSDPGGGNSPGHAGDGGDGGGGGNGCGGYTHDPFIVTQQ